MLKYFPKVSIACIPPINKKASQVFQQIGVYKAIRFHQGPIPEDDDVINWRVASGETVDGERYEDILSEYDSTLAEMVQENFFTGITEAMTNIINHAYDLPRDDGLKLPNKKAWWMFSQSKDGTLTVAIVDLGAGIPATLPTKRPNVWQKLLKFGKSNDSDAIAFAVKDSISRTNKEYRGKGLGQIVKTVDNVPNGRMAILSNGGALIRARGGSRTRRDYRDSIRGTLILWTIALPEDAS